MEMTKRVKVHIGLKCNAKCKFCYYWDKRDSKNPPTEKIKAKLKYANNHGIKDIDFSGGEATIRPDFPELVSYAKQLGFRQICVITNGIKLVDKKYFKELVDCGLNEALFSIEGHNAEVHDELTQIPGSFEKISKAIQNAKELGIRFRTNTTVTRSNYKHIPQLAEHLAEIQPDAVNFILFNDWCSADKLVRDMACKYSEAAPYLKKAIDILDPIVKKVTVRYIPFCFMVGYEKHVCNLLQKKYDYDEWVDSVKTRLLSDVDSKKAEIDYLRFLFRNLLKHPNVILSSGFDFYQAYHDAVVEQMREGYDKKPECKDCKYFYLCDGLERVYASEVGLDELNPMGGKQIKDPFYYRKGYTN